MSKVCSILLAALLGGCSGFELEVFLANGTLGQHQVDFYDDPDAGGSPLTRSLVLDYGSYGEAMADPPVVWVRVDAGPALELPIYVGLCRGERDVEWERTTVHVLAIEAGSLVVGTGSVCRGDGQQWEVRT